VPAGQAAGTEGIGEVQPDVGELDGADRQLFCQPFQQWADRGIQSWTPRHPVACVRDAQLHSLPFASAACVRMNNYTRISSFRGEPHLSKHHLSCAPLHRYTLRNIRAREPRQMA
jgi:hypothetical protein